MRITIKTARKNVQASLRSGTTHEVLAQVTLLGRIPGYVVCDGQKRVFVPAYDATVVR